jgi:hypothetical protein
MLAEISQTHPRRMLMKRTIFVLLTILVGFVAVFGVLVVHPVRTAKAQQPGCSNRTLSGDYGLVGSGYANTGPATLVGLLHFDGDGNLTGSNIYMVVNGVVSGPDSLKTGGTYDISWDCTIALTLSPTWSSHGVVVGVTGNEVMADLENGTGTATLDIKRVWAH